MRTRRRPLPFQVVALVVALTALAGCGEPLPSRPTRPPVALGLVEVAGIGDVPQGAESEPDLVLHFAETEPGAIMAGAGSLQVTLTDHAGLPDSLQFTGLPVVEGPGSLGATATLNGRNVLTLNIVDSDPLNIEPMTISGVSIRASAGAALGAVNAVISGCAGSLAGCTASNVLPSPGEVVAGP